MRWKNGEIILITGDIITRDNGFVRLNAEGEIIEDNRAGTADLEPCKDPLILSDTKYVDGFSIYDLYKGYKEGYPIRIEMDNYIKNLYQERNSPFVGIQKVDLVDDKLVYLLKITFYNGEQLEREVTVDPDNGEILG